MDSAQDVDSSGADATGLVDIDWAGRWRRLIDARNAQQALAADFWDRLAPNFAIRRQPDDPVLSVLEPHLQPRRTLIDAGAGTGRYAVALAERLEWVTAVEPAEAMRARVPALANLTMIATTWEDADVAPADLVLCAHVLYVVREVVPFLRKLEACARERVFVVLRDSPMDHPSSHLWKLLTGEERLRTPYLYDAYNLLHQMGVRPDVDMFSRPFELRFSGVEAAVEDGRLRLGAAWREEEGRQWLSENLEVGADGSAIWRGRDLSEGVLHWRPTPTA